MCVYRSYFIFLKVIINRLNSLYLIFVFIVVLQSQKLNDTYATIDNELFKFKANIKTFVDFPLISVIFLKLYVCSLSCYP